MNSRKLIFAALLLLGAVSCKKTTSGVAANVSNAEAANLITGSLLFGSAGVGSTFGDALAVSQSQSLNINSSIVALVNNKFNTNRSLKTSVKAAAKITCGTTYPDTVMREGAVGSADAFTYTTIYNFTLNCNGDVPNSVTATSTFNGNYTGIYAFAADNGSSNFTVSGLPPADTAIVFSGTYTRAGSFTSRIDTSNHGTYNISIVITKLTVIKPTEHTSQANFVGGTGTVTITGNVPKKGDFNYTGTIVFDAGGDFTGTLTLAGKAYTINLVSGVIGKKA